MSILTSLTLGYEKALTLRTRFTAPNNVRIGYIVVGRSITWNANDSPPVYTDTLQTQFDTANHLLGGKKITGNDVSIVIPRRNWTANTVYTAFDDQSATLFTSNTPLYVYTSAGSVYKCLYNANSANSTIEPTGDYLNNNGFIALGDGYVWKYMYKIDSLDKFITTEWLPCPTEQNDNYFGHANNLIAGAVSQIVIVSGGSGYTQNTTNVVITGAGISAIASANVSNGVIRTVTVSNPGVRYTKQNSNVTITGTGTNANVRLVLAGPFGHAFNPARELGANTVMFSVKLGQGDSTEGGKITSNNDFRQVALWMEPHKYGENVAVDITTANLAVTMTTQVILTSGSTYTIDELVYQGSDVANATFQAYAADVFTNAIHLVGLRGTLMSGSLLKGASSGASRTVVTVTNPDLHVGSGDLVYIENRAPVVRSAGQSENIKLIIRF